MTPQEARRRARDLDAQARHHKAEQRRHRAALHDVKAQQSELRETCETLGIKLTIEGEEGDPHGRPADAEQHPVRSQRG